ncbi:MAG: glycosyl hydrolase 53 family protein [Bacteroidaceae bacterium]|nr:glycosyl hydrolase 53 family protein [Bacteroidaceae bacterium]
MEKHTRKALCLALITLTLGACKSSKHAKQDFALGADISWTTELEERGFRFATRQGDTMECTALMKHLGLNAIRLRVWVNPRNRFCTKEDVLEKALRASRLGMDVMIDFHYSDDWADPGKQYIPKAWAEHGYEEMLDDVRRHTSEVLTYLRAGGISPKWVQVGNETTNGLLWPVGRAQEHPEQYAGLIKAGCQAVKAVFPEAKTIVHLDNGFDQRLYDWNLGILRDHAVDYDLVGMSLYPLAAVEWHADKVSSAQDAIDKCIANIRHVFDTFGKPTLIAEVGVKVAQPEEGRRLLSDVIRKARRKTDGHCLGVLYWEPEAPFSYNGGYDMGAFLATDKVCRPTVIMDAFSR